MATMAIVGITWGDEGKGRMGDLVAEDFQVVCRYQGGNNAGHTVVNQLGTFKLNLLPSGICRENVINILGSGTVIDLEHLFNEIAGLRERGIKITPDNFKISDRAIICLPWHKQQDICEEERLAGKKYGSTRRGIAPVYGDKYLKKTLQMCDLLDEDYLKARLSDLLEYKNLFLSGVYGSRKYTLDEIMDWLAKYGRPFRDYIANTGLILAQAQKEGKNILFEAQLGALKDIDYGICPYTSSSTPLAAYAPIGSGAPFLKVDKVMGIAKAYSTAVGEGPFISEWEGEQAEKLRRAGSEYGAATGRPRRVGPIDLVATSYGVKLQGADCICLTKLDVLSYMTEIPLCVGYKIGQEIVKDFPVTPQLLKAEPVYITMPGWNTDISKVTQYDKLPKEARDYIEYIEKYIQCPITHISVGPGRDEIIYR